jgi:20S proteasome subunit beta 3
LIAIGNFLRFKLFSFDLLYLVLFDNFFTANSFFRNRTMSIMEYNGSAVVAMIGDGCVAIASDRRLGVQQTTVGNDMKKIFKVHDRLYMGLSGLATDVQRVSKEIDFKMNLYRFNEEREIKPRSFGNMLASFLYEKRFGPWYVEPLVAGLEADGKPFICGTDLIGAPVYTDDFVVCGTAEDSLFGTCETMYRPNLKPDELFETIAQCLLSAVDRDCLSGWGCEVVVITKDGATTRTLKGRQD